MFAATLALATLAPASAATPASLLAVSGGGQIAPVGGAFPRALSARVTDAEGAPVAGIDVQFQIDECVSIFGGSACPPEAVYPWFGDHEYGLVATSDANGVATTPALSAGSEPGPYRAVATYLSPAPGGVLLHAYYALYQVDASETRVPITAGFSGAWYDPAQSGHGVILEVLPDDVLLAYWFTFAPDGSQAWFGGTGPILGDQAIVQAVQGAGGRWIPAFDPANYAAQAWGTLTFSFTDCDHGRVDFASDLPNWGWGSMPLTRLSHPASVECTP